MPLDRISCATGLQELHGWTSVVEEKVRFLQEQGEEEMDAEIAQSFVTNTFTMLSLMGKVRTTPEHTSGPAGGQ